jgi:hypothetical protein
VSGRRRLQLLRLHPAMACGPPHRGRCLTTHAGVSHDRLHLVLLEAIVLPVPLPRRSVVPSDKLVSVPGLPGLLHCIRHDRLRTSEPSSAAFPPISAP